MEHRLSGSRRGEIASFLAMDMLTAANEAEAGGRDIIHMEVGQPASRAPAPVIEAAARALHGERIGYTDALGLPALRERIARHYRERYAADVPAERVVVTTGSSAGFILTFLAAFDHGDQIALATPGYPAYRNILSSLGIVRQEIAVGAANRWSFGAEELERVSAPAALRGVLLASPANPTGTMIDEEALGAIARLCRRRGLWLISDEIYHGLTYDRPAATALSHGDDAIIINSFSKYYCMTGWRIGWMVVPQSLVRTVECLAQNLYISPPTISQRAAIAAFDATEELERVRAGYAANRELLLNELPSIGLDAFAPPDGAFYIYADVGHLTDDSLVLARDLLDRAGVAVTPGADFDPLSGSRSIRLSFAGSLDEMREACRRLAAHFAPTRGR